MENLKIFSLSVYVWNFWNSFQILNIQEFPRIFRKFQEYSIVGETLDFWLRIWNFFSDEKQRKFQESQAVDQTEKEMKLRQKTKEELDKKLAEQAERSLTARIQFRIPDGAPITQNFEAMTIFGEVHRFIQGVKFYFQFQKFKEKTSVFKIPWNFLSEIWKFLEIFDQKFENS